MEQQSKETYQSLAGGGVSSPESIGMLSTVNEMAKSMWAKIILALEGVGLIISGVACAPKPIHVEDLRKQEHLSDVWMLYPDDQGVRADINKCASITEEQLKEFQGKITPETLATLEEELRNGKTLVVCEESAGLRAKKDQPPEAKGKRLTKEEADEILKILEGQKTK